MAQGHNYQETPRCQHCGERYYGASQFYDLKPAAQVIPCTYEALKSYLSRNKAAHPSRFLFRGSPRTRVRVLSAEEVIAIRSDMMDKAKIKRKAVIQ